MEKLNRYKENLRIHNNEVWSYSTKVAEIKGAELHLVDWNVGGMKSSSTTTRHINYVAWQKDLKLIK